MSDSSPQVGSKAPDFTLPSSSKGDISLGQVLGTGPVIILFYPSDWGMMCAVEMSTFRDMYKDFEEIGAVFLPISTNSVYSHRAWAEHLRLPFPLLSDFDGRIAKSYGVLCGEEGYLKGRSNRAVFVVDKEGQVRFTWIAEDPSFEPKYDAVLAIAREINGEM